MSKKKLREVTISYAYDSEEWDHINIQYDMGATISVSREQVDAFKRMHKVVRDLQEVERLRDELVSIFGNKAKIPSVHP